MPKGDQTGPADISSFSGIVRASVACYGRSLAPQDAEDLSQEVFVHLLRRQGEIDAALAKSRTDADKLVTVICRNRVIDYMRSPAHLRQHLSLSDDVVAVEADVQRHDDANTDLISAVQKLPHEEQQVIYAIFWENHSEEDTAEKLGMTRWGVRKIRKRALEQLEKIIGE